MSSQIDLLLINGDHDERQLVESATEEAGYQVARSRDVSAAIELLETPEPKPVAVFVCDGVPLKTLNGLLEAIRSFEEIQSVEVILHHTELDSERIRWGVKAGLYFYLTKLTDPDLLRSMIRSAVRTSRAIRRLAKKIIEVEDTFRLLQDGRFLVRTPTEAVAPQLETSERTHHVGLA